MCPMERGWQVAYPRSGPYPYDIGRVSCRVPAQAQAGLMLGHITQDLIRRGGVWRVAGAPSQHVGRRPQPYREVQVLEPPED
jgi:hypothetical protein